MQTRITTGTVVALALGVVLVYAAPAQQRPQPSQPHTGTPPGAKPAGIGSDRQQQNTTVTGCLRRGSSAHSFVLTQTPGSSVPDGGVGTVGGRPQEGNRYQLVAASGIDLSQMVGQQVQVTGARTIGPASARPAGAARAHDGASGNDKDVTRERTTDDPAVGGGTGERNRRSGDAASTRFNVRTIQPAGGPC
jgi:hypothetical protein